MTEEKEKVSKTKYSCECEDFCIPGKSCFLGYVRECDAECGSKCVKKWKPGCGEVRTRKILKKATEDKEVTVYKWEVVEVCRTCAGHLGGCIVGTCGSGCSAGCDTSAAGCESSDAPSEAIPSEVTPMEVQPEAPAVDSAPAPEAADPATRTGQRPNWFEAAKSQSTKATSALPVKFLRAAKSRTK